jgi:hypothetical protein
MEVVVAKVEMVADPVATADLEETHPVVVAGTVATAGTAEAAVGTAVKAVPAVAATPTGRPAAMERRRPDEVQSECASRIF